MWSPTCAVTVWRSDAIVTTTLVPIVGEGSPPAALPHAPAISSAASRTMRSCAIAQITRRRRWRFRLQQLDLDHALEPITDVAVGLDAFAARGVLERPVPQALVLWRDRAGLVLAAHGHDRIELVVHQLLDALRPLCGDVDPDLAHGLDRERFDEGRLDPGAHDLEAVAAKPAQQTLGHLRSGAVVDAKEEDARLVRRHGKTRAS